MPQRKPWLTINHGTVLQSELNPDKRHMVNDPTTIAERLQFRNFISVPNTIAAAMYMIPIAVVPMIGMPMELEKGALVL
jgi:hypothetical protein